jgi:hypothetical protein
MKRNVLLIKGCIGFLTFARFAAIIGTIGTIFIVLIGNVNELLTIDVHRDHSKEMVNKDLLKVKPEYESLILKTELVSVTNNFQVVFEKEMMFPFLIVLVIIMGFSIYLIHLLLQFVKSALNEEFFSHSNVDRIRLMGFILIGLGILNSIAKIWLNWVSRSYFDTDIMEVATVRVNFTPDLLTSTVFIGVIALIVAQAFDHGLKLKEEQELTI